MKKPKSLLLICLAFLAFTLAFLLTPPALADELTPEQVQQVELIIGKLELAVKNEIPKREGAGLVPKALRNQHAKSHGLVEAEFIVSEDVPYNLRQGLFAQPGSYRAWVRFSNGKSELNEQGQPQPDAKPDLRGMAIKVLDVPGKALIDGKPEQDFVLVNHPVFFASNLENFVDFVSISTSPALRTPALAARKAAVKAEIAKLPSQERQQAMAKSFSILEKINSPNKLNGFKKGNSPLNLTYWSTTPYKLGKENVKYVVLAQTSNPKASPPKFNNPNFLRSEMVEQLRTKDAVFDFAVQLQGEKMPINDATVIWSETKSKPIVVATLRIPQQDFDSSMRRELDEELSFTPWHALPEHRPIGEINLARKQIYQQLSQLRHELNEE